MDPELLRTFLAIVAHGGLRRAMATLHRTQPALSARVRELERRIGARLFERVGRGLALTEAGRLLAAEAPALLAAQADVAERVRDLETSERALLRLATVDAASIYVLPPVYRDFRAAYPSTQLRVQVVESRQVATLVQSREVEVGVLTLPAAGADLDTAALPAAGADLDVVPMFEERLVCVASPAHAFARRRGTRLQQLAAEPFVLYGRGSTTRAIIDAAFDAAGVAPLVAMETASPEAMKRLAEVGVGITVVPEALVHDEVQAGRLVRLAIRDVRFERRLGTAVLRGRQLSTAATRFLALVQRHFPPLVRR